MRLFVETGPQAGTHVSLHRDRPTTIGSGEQCDLRIREPGVAAEHAVVKALRTEGYGIKALAAGLRVNGSEVEAAPLAEGDVLEVGTTRISYGREAAAGGPVIPGFRILGKLGTGGMGVVYRAEQVSLHREVALKVLDQRLLADAQFVQHFVAEARAAAKLQHPNVVHVFDVGHHEDTYYYTMEVMHEGSLEAWLRRHGRMPVERALQVVADAAAGLAYAESHGIVHRDIKPDNLMLDQHGTVKIADLGLARTADDGDEKLTGTPHFMAPEQVLRKGVDQRTDLYALGCTFYRLVTGRTPFRGKSVKDILRAHVRETHEPANRTEPSVPADVSAIIDRLLEKDPAARYQSATELLEDLEVLLQPPARKGLWIGLVAAAVVIAGVAIWWAVNKKGDTEIVTEYLDNPEAQRLAVENRELKEHLRQDRARIALLTARLHGGSGIELARALDAVAAEHADTKAADEARQLAARTRDAVAERQAAAAQRREVAGEAIAHLDRAVGTALGARDPEAAWQAVTAATLPEGGDEAVFQSGIGAARDRVQAHAKGRLRELDEAVTGAQLQGDGTALDRAAADLDRILAVEGGWPDALLADRGAVEELRRRARQASSDLRAAELAEQWRNYAEVLRGQVTASLSRADLPAAAAALSAHAGQLGETPVAVRARALAAAAAHGAPFADQLEAAVVAGALRLDVGGETSLPLLRWDRGADALVLADPGRKPGREVTLPVAELTPHQWEQMAMQVPCSEPGRRECFLALLALRAHVASARAYLGRVRPGDDGSGTGDGSYPFGPGPFEQVLRDLPPSDAPWRAGVRDEVAAGRLLAAGLRALSERRNRAAAAHIDQLLAEHPHSIAVATLP